MDKPPVSPSDGGSVDPAPPPSNRRRFVARVIKISAIALLALFVGTQLRQLWREWSRLQWELHRAGNSVIVGYPNIHPNLSYASKPADWYRVEGDTVFLWGGWKDGVGHRWFRMKLGDLDQSEITEPIGRDVTQAIDQPVVERGGGDIWSRIPAGAQVVAPILEGTPCVYPLPVLQKVWVVNDLVNDHPYVIVFNPGLPTDQAVSIFDATLEGRRMTLGTSGFLHKGRPVLYDRGTESLWIQDEGGLTAVSGERKGMRLPLVTRPIPVSWGDWISRNPSSRLVAGAMPRPRTHPPE